MGRIRAVESVTLDGVMQGLGRPDEDTRGGFAHGGWGAGYTDQVAMEFLGIDGGLTGEGAMLFGRRSYQDLLRAWTAATEPNPFTDHLTRVRKFVASRSPGLELGYPNSTLLAGEATETVAALRDEVDGDITVIGSGELVRSLHAAGLVDGYLLQIHPITLGSGTTLFGPGERRDLHLERSATTTTGVIMAEYSVVGARRHPTVGAASAGAAG